MMLMEGWRGGFGYSFRPPRSFIRDTAIADENEANQVVRFSLTEFTPDQGEEEVSSRNVVLTMVWLFLGGGSGRS